MMICGMNIDVAIGAVRDASDPLSCSIEVYDYQKQLRFQVFGPDQKRALNILSISMRDIVDPSILRADCSKPVPYLRGGDSGLGLGRFRTRGRYTVPRQSDKQAWAFRTPMVGANRNQQPTLS
jgi:hypothetical protein